MYCHIASHYETDPYQIKLLLTPITFRYDERNLLGEIEDHLKITIEQISLNMEIPVNEFDGKVNARSHTRLQLLN